MSASFGKMRSANARPVFVMKMAVYTRRGWGWLGWGREKVVDMWAWDREPRHLSTCASPLPSSPHTRLLPGLNTYVVFVNLEVLMGQKTKLEILKDGSVFSF